MIGKYYFDSLTEVGRTMINGSSTPLGDKWLTQWTGFKAIHNGISLYVFKSNTYSQQGNEIIPCLPAGYSTAAPEPMKEQE